MKKAGELFNNDPFIGEDPFEMFGDNSFMMKDTKTKEKISHENKNKKDERDLLHGTLILTIEGSTCKVKEVKDFVSKEASKEYDKVNKAVSEEYYEMGDIYRRYAMRYENADHHLEDHDELFYMDFNFFSMSLANDGNWARVTSVHFVPASNIYGLVLKIEDKIRELKLHASIHYKVFDFSGGIASFYSEIVEGESLGHAEVYHDL